jgi:glycerol-3-phosphate O-acyltransferase
MRRRLRNAYVVAQKRCAIEAETLAQRQQSAENRHVSPTRLPTHQSSHPSIKFENIPAVAGPLNDFESRRARILEEVTRATMNEFSSAQLDLLLGEALYQERSRLKRSKGNLFTRKRRKNDQALWGQIQSGLLKDAAGADRKQLLETVVRHYAEEIGGHFDARIYRIATRVVPAGFSWLLNASSVGRYLPWRWTESLQSRLSIVGEIPALQKLAKQGTILLVPTHQSNIDSVLLGYVIYLMSLPPFAYGAGLNLFSNPALSFFMSRLGSYTVDRQKSNPIYKNVLKHYSTTILRDGVHSIFFPGGGRSRSGAIESKLKLGLLGTALEAQLQKTKEGSSTPKVFVVPMVMSYHFVLEASSLIDDYLAEAGKHRFIIMDDESWQPTKILKFFWKIFSTQSGITVRIGRALDIFGNFVDDDGNSIGPNGTTIEPARWMTSKGQLKHESQRDQEYTRELGVKLAERFHKENTVLTSHLVAFTLFEALRTHYPELDLYRFLRLSRAQRTIPYSEFVSAARAQHEKLVAASEKGELFLSPELAQWDTESWIQDGIKQIGLFHDAAVIRVEESVIFSDDLPLLYYYRNRLAGYGLSLLANIGGGRRAPLGVLSQNDPKGFLA